MGFGMRQQAVELALKVDPSLASELAQDSVEERKQLWLMIAKNAASEGVEMATRHPEAPAYSPLAMREL